jgi:hypothetical protein
MRNRLMSLIIFLGALAFSTSAVAQVYFPAASGGRSKEARDAAAAEPKPAYVPHDLSGVWARVRATDRGGGPIETLLGGAPAPPMTAWGQEQFKANKPSQYQAEASRKVPPALGNDPLGKCDPLGYPRNLGTFEFLQTPTKMVQMFQEGLRLREIWTDGRKIPDDVDPRWYGWAVGHWEGNTLVVDSRGFDGRTWLDGDGHPHSEDMTLQERITHPDAETLVINMTLTDPRAYTKPWVGNPQTFKLLLPKDRTELYEWYCVPSEEESFNEGVRNPAGGIVSKNNNK